MRWLGLDHPLVDATIPPDFPPIPPLPPEAAQGMDMMQGGPEAMGGMTADMMTAMPPVAMIGMDADMMAACPADAMAGMMLI